MKFRTKALVRAFGSSTSVIAKPSYTHISAPLTATTQKTTNVANNTSLMGRVFSGIGTEISKMWQTLGMSGTVAQKTAVTFTRRTLGNSHALPLTSQGQLLLNKFDSVFADGKVGSAMSSSIASSSASTSSSKMSVPIVPTMTVTSEHMKQPEKVISAPRRSSTKKKDVVVDDSNMAPRPSMPMQFSAKDLQGIQLKKNNVSAKRKSGAAELSQLPSQSLSSSSMSSVSQDVHANVNDGSRVGPFTTVAARPFSMLDIQKGQKGLKATKVTLLSFLLL